MTISIDTNVIAALWNEDDPFNSIAMKILSRSQLQTKRVIPGPVFAELMAGPLRSEVELDQFLLETGISVDWDMDERIWREAGRSYRGYADRRRKSDKSYPRRMLTDFLIGAHALVRGHSLLTLDRRLYAAAFPRMKIISD